MAEKFERCVMLPEGRELVPVQSIGRLVSDAMLAYLAEKHANDEVPESDPGHDPVSEAQFLLGYSNDSTDSANVRRAILELRAAGRVVVREADGFGIIRDDDVLRGTLSREDFSRLLEVEWQIRLVAVEPADSAETAFPAAPTGEPAPAAEPVPATDEAPKLQWWRKEYDIPDMAKNIGDRLDAGNRTPSASAIAREIEKRINAIERGKGRDRVAPNWDTIRPYVPKWQKAVG